MTASGAASHTAVLAKMTAELSCLKLSQLRQRARAAGVDQEKLLDILDSDNPKDALVSLLAAASAPAIGGGSSDTAAAKAAHQQKLQALEEELSQLRLGQLEKRALQEGVGVEELDDAADGEQPKAAIIQLILARQPARAGSDDAQYGGTGAAALVLRQKLEAELRGLRLGGANGLHSRASAAGVDADTIEGALDADDPKAQLITLILDCELVQGHLAAMGPRAQAIFDALSSPQEGSAVDTLTGVLQHSAELLGAG